MVKRKYFKKDKLDENNINSDHVFVRIISHKIEN